MKTISNPQSIFGGRAFKLTALDVTVFKPSPGLNEVRVDAAMRDNPFLGSEVGGCFSVLSGNC